MASNETSHKTPEETHLYVVKNKRRLYVTVYPNDDEPDDKESFSWGFLIGPKHEDAVSNSGKRYYVERTHLGTAEDPDIFLWRYAVVHLPNVASAARMYARILIAKVEHEGRLEDLMSSTPRPDSTATGAIDRALHDGYDSQVWASQVLGLLASIGSKDRIVGTAVLDWPRIELTARRYVAEKIAADRYNERYLKETDCRLPKPTWDMLLEKEVVG
ncbi:hypothetical protein ARSEF4850_003516 [Beauveria asiatica]